MNMRSTCATALAILAISPLTTHAATVTWNNAGDDWFDDANWDNGNHPGNGDHAIIGSGTVLLTNVTDQLASLTVSGGTLTFSNWTTKLSATNVTISGGTVTLPGAFTDVQMSNRVWIACSNLTLLPGAAIGVDYLGFARRDGAAGWGYGPGRGYSKSGAGHGGWGGRIESYAAGEVNGTASAPETPGSSGGSFSSTKMGGAGGGAIRIDASGAVVVSGTITSDGDDNTLNAGGGGAGGSIFITCHTFQGTNGIVRANGGGIGGAHSGGGGGGRIAVVYSKAAQDLLSRPTVTFSALGGSLTDSYGDIGTLYFTDGSFLTPNIAHNGWLLSPTFTNWSVSALALTNTWFRFPGAFLLDVTNDVTIYGANGRLQLTNATLTCGGDLVLTSSGELFVEGGVTNATTEDYGALVSVAGNITLSGNSRIYPRSHPTNGGSPLFEAHDVTLNAGCAFDADERGFRGRPSAGDDYGYGPGRGYDESGGGYGGAGGDGGHGPAGGVSYGEADAPVHPGSSGGTARPGSTTYIGADGGGLVRLKASGTLSVYGTISANGEEQTRSSGGGGSGGGVWLTCRTFYGDAGGLLHANGGKGGVYYGGGGGGGRIAVWRYLDSSVGQIPISTTGGAGGANAPAGQDGATGTVVFVNTGPAITNLWATNITATTADLVGNLIYTGKAPAQVICYWGPTDEVEDKGAWATNAALGWQTQGVVTNPVTGLAPATLHYFRFYATNAHGHAWSAPPGVFSTPGGLGIDNDGGAADITDTTATLRGTVTAGNPVPASYFCWGDNNAGRTDTGLWDHVDYAATELGSVSNTIGGLTANQQYFYCAYVTNAGGDAWAPAVTNFTAGPPLVAINDLTLTEGDSGTTNFDFTITLSASSSVPVSVVFVTSNGWADAPADYASTGGVLTIPAGQMTGVISVPVVGDTVDEYPYQDFYVNLSNPTNGTVTDGQGRGTITDDDDLNQTKTWTGIGNWNSRTNWSPAGSPSPADDVVIASGELSLSNAVTVSSVTMTSGLLVFTNWTTKLSAGDMAINGGTITHVAHSDTNGADGWALEARVWIACSNLTLASGAAIDVEAKGYPQRSVMGRGYGPGSGYSRSGAGHGGWGGLMATYGPAGGDYGSWSDPQMPGSSGGTWDGTRQGGIGGGVIRVQAAGAVVVDGTISADGGDNTGNTGGGGSGGSIYIACRTIDGADGHVRADGGGTGGLAGGGGGGRIAVVYDTTAQAGAGVPGVTFTADLGPNGDLSGGLGTLSFEDNLLLSGAIPHRGVWLSPEASGQWALDSLTLSGGHLRFPSPGAVLSVSNDVRISGNGSGLALGGNTHWTNLVSEYRLVSSPSSHWLRVGGELVLTNGASLHVYAAATNGADFGGLVSVTGNMSVANGCWVYPYTHRTNGGPVLFEVAELRVASGGGFDADAKGWSGGEKGQGGHGPGASSGAGSYDNGAGAGYGGAGGSSWTRSGGAAYGSSNAPAQAGSGGDGSSGEERGGYGGGAVRIAAGGTVTLDGTLTARGENGAQWHSGGGSGGGIWVTCRRFTGSGAMEANGGDRGYSRGGEGGGGRIAVWYQVGPSQLDDILQGTGASTILITTNLEAYTGTTSAQAGAPGTAADGQDGTVVFLTVLSPAGTLFMVN